MKTMYWPGEDEQYWDDGYQELPPLEHVPADAGDVGQEMNDYYKGNMKDRNVMNLGCHICGSKWHLAAACPVNQGKSGGKFQNKGKGKYGGYRRPYGGKGKGLRPRYGKGYSRPGGYGRKGKGGYSSYYQDDPRENRPPLKISPTKPTFTMRSEEEKKVSNNIEYHNIASSSSEELLHEKPYVQNMAEVAEKVSKKEKSESRDFNRKVKRK